MNSTQYAKLKQQQPQKKIKIIDNLALDSDIYMLMCDVCNLRLKKDLEFEGKKPDIIVYRLRRRQRISYATC